MFKNNALVMLCFLLVAMHTNAQNNLIKHFTISGKVVDAGDMTDLPGATVFLYPTDTLKRKITITKADGAFTFHNLDSGHYYIKVTSMGYTNYLGEPILLSNNIQLTPIFITENSHMLNEVAISVAVKKRLVENKGDRLVYNASSDQSNKSGNAADVLKKVPMLTIGAAGELKMRGNANIKVLINGKPSGIMARNLQEALKMIPASAIESIEVITNPSAKYEAEGAAGVVNIITKKKMYGTTVILDLSAGNIEQNASITINHAIGKLNLSASLNANNNQMRNTLFMDRRTLLNNKQIGLLEQTAEIKPINRGAFGNLAAEYQINNSQKIETTFSYWNGQWPEIGSFRNKYYSANLYNDFKQESNQKGAYNYYEINTNYQKKFIQKNRELQVIGQVAFYDDYTKYTTKQLTINDIQTQIENGNNLGKGKEWSFQADYTHPFLKSEKSTIDLGIRYSGVNAENNYQVDNSSNVGYNPERSDFMRYFQHIYAAYVSINLITDSGWTFRPGLRFESTSLGGAFVKNSPSFSSTYSNLLYSLLLMKNIGEFNQLKLNYSERIKRPWIWDLNPYINASDPLNLSSGNPRLKPEINRAFEIGHNYNAKADKFSLTNSIYYTYNSNAIENIRTVSTDGISKTTPQNIATNQRLGANTAAYFKVRKKLTINLGMDLFYLKFRSNTLGILKDGYFYTTNISLGWEFPKSYSFQASGDYGNGFISLQGKTYENYSYHFGLAKELFSKKATITISANNLFRSNFTQRSSVASQNFDSRLIQQYYNRSFSISFSWRFGSEKTKDDSNKKLIDKQERPMHGG